MGHQHIYDHDVRSTPHIYQRSATSAAHVATCEHRYCWSPRRSTCSGEVGDPLGQSAIDQDLLYMIITWLWQECSWSSIYAFSLFLTCSRDSPEHSVHHFVALYTFDFRSCLPVKWSNECLDRNHAPKRLQISSRGMISQPSQEAKSRPRRPDAMPEEPEVRGFPFRRSGTAEKAGMVVDPHKSCQSLDSSFLREGPPR